MFVGGFLGAGKTTAIRSLGKILTRNGQSVAVITNDQAAGLVDTAFLQNNGLATREVAGSCFCCNFDGLSQVITKIFQDVRPDIILAEPVGSCTDIVATVIGPILKLECNRLKPLAYSVLVEPPRWRELMEDDGDEISSMKFLFDKQLEEADVIIITKTDTLNKGELDALSEKIGRRYPEARVLTISAIEGAGLEEWLDLVQMTPPGEMYIKEIDYYQYAKAEADMGWLNAGVYVQFPEPIDGNAFAVRIADGLKKGICERNGRIGNLKILAADKGGSVKCGTSLTQGKPLLDDRFSGPLDGLEIMINVRATVSPNDLASIVQSMVEDIKATEKVKAEISYLNTFRPSPPNPTYRFME